MKSILKLLFVLVILSVKVAFGYQPRIPGGLAPKSTPSKATQSKTRPETMPLEAKLELASNGIALKNKLDDDIEVTITSPQPIDAKGEAQIFTVGHFTRSGLVGADKIDFSMMVKIKSSNEAPFKFTITGKGEKLPLSLTLDKSLLTREIKLSSDKGGIVIAASRAEPTTSYVGQKPEILGKKSTLTIQNMSESTLETVYCTQALPIEGGLTKFTATSVKQKIDWSAHPKSTITFEIYNAKTGDLSGKPENITLNINNQTFTVDAHFTKFPITLVIKKSGLLQRGVKIETPRDRDITVLEKTK